MPSIIDLDDEDSSPSLPLIRRIVVPIRNRRQRSPTLIETKRSHNNPAIFERSIPNVQPIFPLLMYYVDCLDEAETSNNMV